MSDLISRQDAIEAMECINDSICAQQAVDAILDLPTAESQWVPVTDGLPEEGWCLCTVHGVFYDYCEILFCRKRKRKMRFFRLDDDGEYVDFTNWVTAWMPLPEPWRGEEDE